MYTFLVSTNQVGKTEERDFQSEEHIIKGVRNSCLAPGCERVEVDFRNQCVIVQLAVYEKTYGL